MPNTNHFTIENSTGVFVLGPKKGMAVIGLLEGVDGMVVDDKGHISVSTKLKGKKFQGLHFK